MAGPPHMARKKAQLEIVARHGQSAAARSAPPVVSGRWILAALGVVIVAAGICAWGSLCLLFWQGAWQLLYRPAAVVARTPAAAGIAFDPAEFAAKETGAPRLRGWWIAAAAGAGDARYTVLYLHGRRGNLGDCVNKLAEIHAAGVNVFAFDYRGYGQSEFAHPSEARWRQDADWALYYLTATRQVPVSSIVLVGSGLGANLALEVAAAHPELGGVVLDAPLNAPVDMVFKDARARLVPAHLLFHDRYRMQKPAAALRIPSLWILAAASKPQSQQSSEQPLIHAFNAIMAPKRLIRPIDSPAPPVNLTAELTRWLSTLKSER